MDLRGIREINTGFGEGLAAAFEMLGTPFIFGFLGHLIDQKLGLETPVFLLLFAIVVFSYECWKLFDKYTRDMARHEANAPWNRTPAAATTDAQGEAA